jgi:raffinose/stachyose/melibiose transport system substrate-binding protein
MTRRTSRKTRTVTAALGALLALAACAPGSGGSDNASSPKPGQKVRTDAAKLGTVTLTVWDQEVRGGQAAQMTALNKAFHAKYPNITIKRVSRSFDDLKKTLRLALSGKDAPDVVESNNGRSDMGEFVKAGQLRPLTAYEKAYGWDSRYPASVRQYSSYSPDGKKFGAGTLYGLPQVGEVVGIYYDKKVLASAGVQPPTTWTEFESALATVKAAGQIPLMFGNLDKWPAIHVLGTIQGRTTPPVAIKDLAFGRSGASWTTPANTKAAQTLVDWVDKGYFEPDVNGEGYDPAWQAFSKGKGAFLIGGTWLQADLQKAMGADVGFMLPPGESATATPVATGGTGLPFTITTKSKNPDAAAAYIDFITDTNAMQVLSQTGNLPIADTAQQAVNGGLQKDVFTAFGSVVKADGLVPYLDYATPTMYDTLTASLQDLIAKKVTPAEFLDTVQKDYSSFASAN